MKRRFNLMLFFLAAGYGCFAQTRDAINGIVADSLTMDPLPFVNIRIKGSWQGTTTDAQGNFSLLAGRRDTLQFSLVGYKTLEMPVWNWEPSVILLAEDVIMLESVTVEETPIDNFYNNLFDDQNEKLRKANRKIPFYYSREKKEDIKVNRLENENLRVNTYVEVVVNNPRTKEDLMKKYRLTEDEYYGILTKFNEKNYAVMYYLTPSELLSMLNRFYAGHQPRR